ncbi:hypothetical protein BGX38DRAFT_1267804 [Terfezia claveryi]|nr:hypothetical protein BGX38DRAFT_1267804 [Terfezia claveryi]
MPVWSSRLVPASYGPTDSNLAHSHSRSNSVARTGIGGAGSSSAYPPLEDQVSRVPHSRSYSHQVTSSAGNSISTSRNEGRNLGVKGALGDAKPPSSDVGLTTGQCMCCDSTVRWPKNLFVFRCMICRTINDLKPLEGRKSPEVSQISIEETRTLIDSCVSGFLDQRSYLKLLGAQALSYPQSHPAENNPTPTEAENTPSNAGSLYLSIGRPSLGSLSDKSTSCSSGIPSSHQSLISGLLDEEKQPFNNPLPFLSDEHGHREHSESHRIQQQASSNPIVSGNVQLPSILKEHSEISESLDLNDVSERRKRYRALAQKMFKPLEVYITACFTSWECLNGSFIPGVMQESRATQGSISADILGGRDQKTLAEGDYEKSLLSKGRRKEREKQCDKEKEKGVVTLKTPAIDWDRVREWYELVIDAGSNIMELSREEHIKEAFDNKEDGQPIAEKSKEKEEADDIPPGSEEEEWDLAEAVEEARLQVVKVLLVAMESILKRPGRPLKDPGDIRFLLIILENPLLYPSYSRPKPSMKLSRKQEKSTSPGRQAQVRPLTSTYSSGPGQHSAIIKRIIGLISILPNVVHHYIVSWLSRLPEPHFRRIVELGGSFVTYRLNRQSGRKKPLGGVGGGSIGGKRGRGVVYNDDWQIRAVARFMALLFSANNSVRSSKVFQFESEGPINSPAESARRQAQARGQIILTSDFYNMLLDYADLIADFDSWENRTGKFCFCQYPFLFSMGAKIHILEYDARRQMEAKARDAFFSSLTNRQAVNQYLVLKVRRDCLVEDSLKGISEGVGGMGDIKKGLRIEFVGEDGVDAGGLRKEWFLLLVRDVFDPNYGLFIYDDDSRYCYFNSNSFESSEEFFLIGVVFGLAIYNSTILDVALPPVVFKKLLQPSGMANALFSAATLRPPQKYTLDDLAVFRPSLARGLCQLLEFEGDVEEVFCRSFSVEIDRFGQLSTVALVPGGENIPVTNSNRRDFVDKYITYLLDTSVAKQFEPFKRGFYTVCGGNALSLFRPEEIELLVRGSDEALDISALRAVAIYEGWGAPVGQNKDNPVAENDPVVKWFWSFFERITPKEQRLLLTFITGSDRIPAMGATNLVIKLVCLGGDCERFPVARTCFNALCLYRYKRREKLEKMLWRAVEESEGFGLK